MQLAWALAALVVSQASAYVQHVTIASSTGKYSWDNCFGFYLDQPGDAAITIRGLPESVGAQLSFAMFYYKALPFLRECTASLQSDGRCDESLPTSTLFFTDDTYDAMGGYWTISNTTSKQSRRNMDLNRTVRRDDASPSPVASPSAEATAQPDVSPSPAVSASPSPSASPSSPASKKTYVIVNDASYTFHLNRSRSEERAYYCLEILAVKFPPGSDSVSVDVEVVNPFGKLPGPDLPKIAFYSTLSLIYLVLGIVWMVLTFIYWTEILPIQNYIMGLTFLLFTDMAMNFGYYMNYNETGERSLVILTFAVILDALRNSISFMVILMVALGYGVVRPTLGSAAKKVFALTFSNFAFGMIVDLSKRMDPNGKPSAVGVMFALPLVISMTIFYSWTLTSLDRTSKKLELRRQTAKLLMYRRLFRLLACSVPIAVIFLIVFVALLPRTQIEWWASAWPGLWFLNDGWSQLLYLAMFIGFLILWRPTDNNRRYGLEELPSDDEEPINGAPSNVDFGGSIKMRTVNSGENEEEDSDLGDPDADLQWVEDNIGNPSSSQNRSGSPTRQDFVRLEVSKLA